MERRLPVTQSRSRNAQNRDSHERSARDASDTRRMARVFPCVPAPMFRLQEFSSRPEWRRESPFLKSNHISIRTNQERRSNHVDLQYFQWHDQHRHGPGLGRFHVSIQRRFCERCGSEISRISVRVGRRYRFRPDYRHLRACDRLQRWTGGKRVFVRRVRLPHGHRRGGRRPVFGSGRQRCRSVCIGRRVRHRAERAQIIQRQQRSVPGDERLCGEHIPV